MKHIKRITLIVVAVLVLACSVPLSSLAVDPVSAATMANALAQAITAYGASQGVSMTFDVANTDGIGEGVHELWDQYQDDMANSNITVSDYQNLAASAFPTLWIKIGQKIGINLDAASVGEIDGFWNWLLSGPAEMTKVDNEYYEWTLNQNNTVDPISVFSVYDTTINGYQMQNFPYSSNTLDGVFNCTDNSAFWFASGYSNWDTRFFFLSPNPNISVVINYNYTPSTPTTINLTGVYSGGGYTYYYGYFDIRSPSPAPPYISTNYSAYSPDSILGSLTSSSVVSDSSGISVQPYVGDAVPQDIYIPDNTDVNYEPIPASIPTDISWDDTLFGDGTGTLTDAQSEAITQTVDQAIEDNPAKTIELADTAPPAPSPSEVYIPFLPVTLPSFNFSLSGIWHYVTAWVASLGAWFSLVFTTWSYLPYAISVPVYATAVIVIVLGVYKRFFM